MSLPEQVLAAGGVVIRESKKGPKVLLIHRPGHDDWSLPKGKLDPGESFRDAAVREVAEETGVVTRLGRELQPARYIDRQGRPKIVRYWRMSVRDEVDWVPDDEVDEIEWVRADTAIDRLTYEHDRALVAAAIQRPDELRLAIVRHAHAGVRAKWEGDDRLRPLSKRGRRQSKGLVKTFRRWEVGCIATSPLRRCKQTVAPLAAARDVVARTDNRIAEGASLEAIHDLVAALGDGGVACSHGDEISKLIGDLASHSDAFPRKPTWSKGSVWWLVLGGDGVVRKATYQPPTA